MNGVASFNDPWRTTRPEHSALQFAAAEPNGGDLDPENVVSPCPAVAMEIVSGPSSGAGALAPPLHWSPTLTTPTAMKRVSL